MSGIEAAAAAAEAAAASAAAVAVAAADIADASSCCSLEARSCSAAACCESLRRSAVLNKNSSTASGQHSETRYSARRGNNVHLRATSPVLPRLVHDLRAVIQVACPQA